MGAASCQTRRRRIGASDWSVGSAGGSGCRKIEHHWENQGLRHQNITPDDRTLADSILELLRLVERTCPVDHRGDGSPGH
jgi:hypothetical protein